MSNDAWIEQSLARLETLEAQKAQYEQAGQAAPAELEAEIQTLYETLEAVADDGEGEEQPAPAPAAVPDDPFGIPPAAAAIAQPSSAMEAAPFGEPMMAAPQAPPDMGMGTDAGMGMEPSVGFDDGDLRPAKSKGPMVLGALVVVGAVSAGGWYMMQQQNAKAPPPQPTGEAKVIGASEIPEDTQEPDVAKGGSADRTPGTEIKESSRSRSSGRKSGGSRSGGGNRSSGKKKDDGRKIEIGGNNKDPLAGLD